MRLRLLPTFALAILSMSKMVLADPPHLWSLRFGDSDARQTITDLALTDGGDCWVVGTLDGTANLGGGTLTSAGCGDILVAKFSDNGGHLWSCVYGDSNCQTGPSVAVGDGGDVFLAGLLQGSINFGGGTLTSAGGPDVFLAKLDADGNHLWSAAFGSPEWEFTKNIAVDPSNNVFVAGWFRGSFTFGGGTLSAGSERSSIFVAKFDSNGGHVWSHAYGDDSSDAQPRGLAVDGFGNPVITGYFSETINFGAGELVAQGGAETIFLAKLGSAGAGLWSHSFGDYSYQIGEDVAVDDVGNVILTGQYQGAVDFGGGTMWSIAGSSDAFVARFDSDGNHDWSIGFGDWYTQRGFRVAMDDMGNGTVFGNFSGSISLGTTTLTSAGNEDLFVAQFDSIGQLTWFQSFGDWYSQTPFGIDADHTDSVVMAGYFDGTLNFGGSDLTSAGNGDAFLVKFGPNPTGFTDLSTIGLARIQAFPNPFNPQSTISYVVPASGPVLLTVYDVKGFRVRTLVDEYVVSGHHEVIWRSVESRPRVASGIYFVRLVTSGQVATQKLVLLK